MGGCHGQGMMQPASKYRFICFHTSQRASAQRSNRQRGRWVASGIWGRAARASAVGNRSRAPHAVAPPQSAAPERVRM